MKNFDSYIGIFFEIQYLDISFGTTIAHCAVLVLALFLPCFIGDENFSKKFPTHINSEHLTSKVCKNSLRFYLTGLNYNILVNCSPWHTAEALGEGAPNNLIIKLRTSKYGLLL